MMRLGIAFQALSLALMLVSWLGLRWELADPIRDNPVQGLELVQLVVALVACVACIGGFLSGPKDGSAAYPVVTAVSILCLVALAVPSFPTRRDRANTRACYANQKTLESAIDMFAIDRKKPLDALDANAFRALRSGGYVQSIPTDPGQGPGTSGNYKLRAPGQVACERHGSYRR